ncbi:MAG: FtsH protease activity modulator HflK [Candidatus Omnitrophica bacterium]|nr:FtsH protease activity modulator HflK [Candidatus Omnitrophota bacterium]
MNDFRTPEDLFKEGTQKVSAAGKDMMKYIPFYLTVFFIIMVLKSGVYSIGPDEVGVMQRFGRYTKTVDPGLHFKLPLGIDKVTPVKVEKIFKEEFGFRTLLAGVNTQYSTKNYLDESLLLTGDLNILNVQWIVQFKVKDPVKLLFATRNPVENVRDLSEVVMSRLCGDYRVDELLTTKREEVGAEAQSELQVLLDKYNTGVQVVTVKLLDVNPPDVVKPAFNEVNEARQERERMINDAWKEYNKVIPRAKGEAQKTISQAEGYALDKINRAKGEASRFISQWQEYAKAPDITKKRLYLEAMTEVMPKTKQKYITDIDQKTILPLLDLTKGEQS